MEAFLLNCWWPDAWLCNLPRNFITSVKNYTKKYFKILTLIITSFTGGCGTVFTTFDPLSTLSSAPLSEYKEKCHIVVPNANY